MLTRDNISLGWLIAHYNEQITILCDRQMFRRNEGYGMSEDEMNDKLYKLISFKNNLLEILAKRETRD